MLAVRGDSLGGYFPTKTKAPDEHLRHWTLQAGNPILSTFRNRQEKSPPTEPTRTMTEKSSALNKAKYWILRLKSNTRLQLLCPHSNGEEHVITRHPRPKNPPKKSPNLRRQRTQSLKATLLLLSYHPPSMHQNSSPRMRQLVTVLMAQYENYNSPASDYQPSYPSPHSNSWRNRHHLEPQNQQ